MSEVNIGYLKKVKMVEVNISNLEKVLEARDKFDHGKHSTALLASLDEVLIESVKPLIKRVKELEQQRSILAERVSEYANRSDDMGDCSCCDFSGYCDKDCVRCTDAVLKWCEKVVNSEVNNGQHTA